MGDDALLDGGSPTGKHVDPVPVPRGRRRAVGGEGDGLRICALTQHRAIDIQPRAAIEAHLGASLDGQRHAGVHRGVAGHDVRGPRGPGGIGRELPADLHWFAGHGEHLRTGNVVVLVALADLILGVSLGPHRELAYFREGKGFRQDDGFACTQAFHLPGDSAVIARSRGGSRIQIPVCLEGSSRCYSQIADGDRDLCLLPRDGHLWRYLHGFDHQIGWDADHGQAGRSCAGEATTSAGDHQGVATRRRIDRGRHGQHRRGCGQHRVLLPLDRRRRWQSTHIEDDRILESLEGCDLHRVGDILALHYLDEGGVYVQGKVGMGQDR